MIEQATVTAPEMIGLLAWWIVMLAAPVMLIRRWRRRPSAVRRGPHAAPRPGGAVMAPVDSLAHVQAGEPSAPSSQAPKRDPAVDGSSGSAPPSAPRLPSGTLEPLCRYVDFQRRLELAASELRVTLARLPPGRWRVEHYPLTGERRNTFLIMGETGIFVVSATYAPGHWDDVIAVTTLASKIQVLLPGYRGQVRPAICHPFTPTEPRIWYRPDEHGDWVGAWLVGGDSVIGWLMQFGPQHGLSTGDLASFDALAKANWRKGAIPTAPSWPQIREAPSPGSHE
jgi:hypothetical protein